MPGQHSQPASGFCPRRLSPRRDPVMRQAPCFAPSPSAEYSATPSEHPLTKRCSVVVLLVLALLLRQVSAQLPHALPLSPLPELNAQVRRQLALLPVQVAGFRSTPAQAATVAANRP